MAAVFSRDGLANGDKMNISNQNAVVPDGSPFLQRTGSREGSEELQQEMSKVYRAAKKEYRSRHIEKGNALLAANRAALTAFTTQRLRNGGAEFPKSLPIPKLQPGAINGSAAAAQQQGAQTDGSGALAGNEAAPEAAAAAAAAAAVASLEPLPPSRRPVPLWLPNGQTMKVAARSIPAAQPPPTYTTWSYLKRNELARDHGRRMFLVDSSGETVPADDGDVETRLPWDAVDGAAVDFAMSRVAEQYGWDNGDVLDVLYGVLKACQPEAIAQRLAYLRRLRSGQQRRTEDTELDQHSEILYFAFCRRCRLYSCPTHNGGHVLPHHRAAPMPSDPAAPPCGPRCWKLEPARADGRNHQAGTAAGSADAAAAAAAAADPAGRSGTDPVGQSDDMEVDGGPSVAATGGSGAAGGAGGDGSAKGRVVAGNGVGEGAGGGGDAAPRKQWSPYMLSTIRRLCQLFPGTHSYGAGLRRPLGDPCKIAGVLGTAAASCAEVKAALDEMESRDLGTAIKEGVVLAAAVAAGPAELPPAVVLTGAAEPAVAAGNGVGAAAAGVDTAAVPAGAGAAAGPAPAAAAVAATAGGGFGPALSGAEATRLSQVPAKRKGSKAKKTAAASTRTERSLVVANRSHKPNGVWPEYQPCNCAGKCRAECPCVQASNFCEKFCACSLQCAERFRGCSCKSGCKDNKCPCAAAGRECDPDLCGACAATIEGRAEPSRECHNMRLRMRQHAHVVLGTSDIPDAGWGLFAAQYVSKNGFLGEYTGDLITQDEANRRGSVYDQMNNSYLFDLNAEWVVDAKFRGNKMRCANHSEEPVAKAKVLMVDGESRIAIFADRNVTPGMEITYDYRYSEDLAPFWVKKKQRGAPGAAREG